MSEDFNLEKDIDNCASHPCETVELARILLVDRAVAVQLVLKPPLKKYCPILLKVSLGINISLFALIFRYRLMPRFTFCL